MAPSPADGATLTSNAVSFTFTYRSGNLSVAGGPVDTSPVVITFIGIYAGVDVPTLSSDATAITGTTPTLTVEIIQQRGS